MEREQLVEFLKQYGLLVILAIIGLGLVGWGVWRVMVPESPTVEIISAETDNQTSGTTGQVVVDVAGEVEKPGVYKMPSGSRIGDALVMAGGLASGADRGWVSRYMNLAEEVKDGGKIFIPGHPENSENQNTPVEGQTAGESDSTDGQINHKININTATVSELDSLWGIGEARAQTIITSRPYGAVEELLSKAKIPQNVYDAIKDQVSVY